jgi:hypothetical protein
MTIVTTCPRKRPRKHAQAATIRRAGGEAHHWLPPPY